MFYQLYCISKRKERNIYLRINKMIDVNILFKNKYLLIILYGKYLSNDD